MKTRPERLLKLLLLSLGFLCIVVVAQAQQYNASSSYYPGEDIIIIREVCGRSCGSCVRDEEITVSYYNPNNSGKIIKEVYSTYPRSSCRKRVVTDRKVRVTYYLPQNTCPTQTYYQETYSGKVRRIITTTTTITTVY